MMNWFRKLEGDDYVLLAPIVGFLAVMGISFIMLFVRPATAQDTAPAWEYLFVSYDGQTASTSALLSDEAASAALNATFESLKIPVIVETEEAASSSDEEIGSLFGFATPTPLNPRTLAVIFDYLGAQGWELVTAQFSSFVFKRPKD